jgi:type II secretory pathway component GspD/PulD (secretin)
MGFFGQAGSGDGFPSTTTSSSSTGGTDTTTTAATVLDPRNVISGATALGAGKGLSFLGGIHSGLDLVAQLLETDSNFKVFARSTVFTQNNTPASLSSGQRIPIASSTQSNFFGGGATNNGNFLSNVQYQDILLSLNIVPLINSKDEITLQISQQNSEAGEKTKVSGNDYPVINTQELTTIVSCPNNGTILLGGLVRQKDTRTNSRVPIISSIPVLGKLFGSRSRDEEARELLIFIQPRIMEDLSDAPPSAKDSIGNSAFGEQSQRFLKTGEGLPPPRARSRGIIEGIKRMLATDPEDE